MSEITPITPASNESAPFMLQYAMDYMDEELDKLLALSHVLVRELEPKDPKNPTDSDNLTAWRTAEILCERLNEVEFSNTMREMVLSKQAV